MNRHLLPTLALCILFAACGTGFGHRGLEPGTAAPSFQLATLDGAELSSESLQGEVVVLNFWATWCGPCRKEIPALKAIAESGEAKVVAISLDKMGLEKVQPFVDKHKIEYTVLLGGDGTFAKYGGRAIPYTLVLDRDLNVFSSYLGTVRASTLKKAIRRAAERS